MLCVFASAQNFRSAELSDIYALANKSGLKYEVCADSTGRITHLGSHIFNSVVKKSFPTPIINFIERYHLYLNALTPSARKSLISEKKLVLVAEDFLAVDSLCGFSLHLDGGKYTAVFDRNGFEVCRLGFENSFSLIYGMNIKEAQRFFIDDITNFKDTDCGKYSDTASVNIQNIFSGTIKNYYALHIIHNLYNYDTVCYDIPLQKFVNYCLINDCKPTAGIESVNNDTVKFTVVYKNSIYGYNHLIYGTLTVDDLKNLSGVIPVRLHTYIPTHNLKDLYNDKTH